VMASTVNVAVAVVEASLQIQEGQSREWKNEPFQRNRSDPRHGELHHWQRSDYNDAAAAQWMARRGDHLIPSCLLLGVRSS